MSREVIRLLTHLAGRGHRLSGNARQLVFGPPPVQYEPILYPVVTHGPWRGDWVDAAPGCKALLLEVIRRASFDWVLYQSSTRIQQKRLSEEAYTWLFLEGPGHPDWTERVREGTQLMSFLGVCEALDLEPDQVRGHIRRLTPKHVQSIGRPPERKYVGMEDRVGVNVDVDSLFVQDSDSLGSLDSLAFPRY